MGPGGPRRTEPRGTARRCEDAPRQDRRARAREWFFRTRARQGRPAERQTMIDRTHALHLARQAAALGISRGAIYYQPRHVPSADLALMRRLDELHLDQPAAGARLLRRFLAREGIAVGRRHVRTLMRHMRLTGQAPQPGTSRRHRAHPVYPYLLRHRVVADHPQHRSRQSIHQRRLHRVLAPARHPDQHGRAALLAGQRVRRTTPALPQVRRGLPARLRLRLARDDPEAATSPSTTAAVPTAN